MMISGANLEAKNSAEKSMHLGNFEEACLQWSHALKLLPDTTYFIDQRCVCFLQSGQHFYALQDAEDLIRLEPNMSRGFMRKAEVLHATSHYEQAVKVIDTMLLRNCRIFLNQ